MFSFPLVCQKWKCRIKGYGVQNFETGSSFSPRTVGIRSPISKTEDARILTASPARGPSNLHIFIIFSYLYFKKLTMAISWKNCFDPMGFRARIGGQEPS